MGTMRYCDFGASGAAGAWFRCSSAFLRVSSKPPEPGGATGAAPPAGWLCDAGAGPTFEVPHLEGYGDRGWTKPRFHTIAVRTHVQEMNENVFDLAHFVTVHHFQTDLNLY